MTTDVINGVPRSLLEGIADHLEWDGSEPLTTIQYAYKCDDLARDLRALLATARPAADGEREAFESIYGVIRVEDDTTPEDQTIYKLERAAFHSGAVWQARAAQPQQSVAVTDEVQELKDLLRQSEAELEDWRLSFPDANSHDTDVLLERIDAALSAHKTGEEE